MRNIHVIKVRRELANAAMPAHIALKNVKDCIDLFYDRKWKTSLTTKAAHVTTKVQHIKDLDFNWLIITNVWCG